MNFQVKQHLLHINNVAVEQAHSPNGSNNVRQLYLIFHYTAGTTAEGAISWFKRREAEASAHLVIDRDGSVTQTRPFNKSAWHAGKSTWRDLIGLNSYSLGIELVNAGKLKQSQTGQWLSWSNVVISPEEVIVATHQDESSPAGWQLYTSAQIEVATLIGIALNNNYTFLDVLGHEDVSPHRKVDPGPAFPMLSLKSRILGRQ